jgi:hypothetical protein
MLSSIRHIVRKRMFTCLNRRLNPSEKRKIRIMFNVSGLGVVGYVWELPGLSLNAGKMPDIVMYRHAYELIIIWLFRANYLF